MKLIKTSAIVSPAFGRQSSPRFVLVLVDPFLIQLVHFYIDGTFFDGWPIAARNAERGINSVLKAHLKDLPDKVVCFFVYFSANLFLALALREFKERPCRADQDAELPNPQCRERGSNEQDEYAEQNQNRQDKRVKATFGTENLLAQLRPPFLKRCPAFGRWLGSSLI